MHKGTVYWTVQVYRSKSSIYKVIEFTRVLMMHVDMVRNL